MLAFKTQTYDLEVGNSNVIGGKHILTYGGNCRRNNFDITLAPGAQDRNEFGAYFQEEFYVDKFRARGWAAAPTSSATSTTGSSRRASA